MCIVYIYIYIYKVESNLRQVKKGNKLKLTNGNFFTRTK